MDFYFIDPRNYLHIMRSFLSYMKNETLDEIKTSLENLWRVFFRFTLVLILKWKRLLGAGRIRCGKSGTPLINIYVRWCHAPTLSNMPLGQPLVRRLVDWVIRCKQYMRIFVKLLFFTSVVHCDCNIFYETGLIQVQSKLNQHCGYRWPNALPPVAPFTNMV